MSSLIKKVQNTIFQHKLLERSDKIILAVSGGPDSTCLLDVFSKLQKKYNLELIIAHVNYGLRGRDSDGDEKFVRKLAEKYGCKIFVYNANVGTQFIASGKKARLIALPQKAPSENKLRQIRYDYLEKIKSKNNFDYIAVAHNADDQVETFLMRIIRGAGLHGMSAMRHKNGSVIRPLLNISRKEILAYLKKNKLRFRTDKTNLESNFLRNKIRNKLIPTLEKNYNPRIRRTILASVESVAEDQAFLQSLTDSAYSKMNGLKVSGLSSFPAALQKRILLKIIGEKKSDLMDVKSTQLNEIMKIVGSTKSKKQIMKLKGLKVARSGDKLEIEILSK